MRESGNQADEAPDLECPGCGLPRQEWPHKTTEGFLSKDGDYYCCQNCLEGRPCECGGTRQENKGRPEELLRRPKGA